MELILGDCLEELEKMKDNSIDCVITSPPYDNLRTYKDTLEWGEHIWKPVIKELFRVAKEGGVMVWVVGDATIKGSETGTSFKQALWAKKCGFNLHDTMIWEKAGQGAVGSNYCYWQNFEYMFVLSKGRPKSINLIEDRRNVYNKSKYVHGSRGEDGKSKSRKMLKHKDFGRRFNIWKITQETNKIHKAVFPEQLADNHIRSWTEKGDTVLDPFMGSGTTGVVCKKLGREFVGIEIVPEYYDLAKSRIENTATLFI